MGDLQAVRRRMQTNAGAQTLEWQPENLSAHTLPPRSQHSAIVLATLVTRAFFELHRTLNVCRHSTARAARVSAARLLARSLDVTTAAA